MQKMKLFVDTHSATNGTFPAGIAKDAFTDVYAQYVTACAEENVVIVKTMINANDGKMFCLNFAENVESIERAHQKVGLTFDSITEVTTTSPGDIYFDWK